MLNPISRTRKVQLLLCTLLLFIESSAQQVEDLSGNVGWPYYGDKHPCFRKCGDHKMTCVYNFTVSTHSTMSLDCRNCPYNREDCSLPNCIPGGGIVRTITVANNALPGPSIIVCEHDRVIVNLQNDLRTDTVTIHWHGLHQVDSFFMDGVPWISQIPIMPSANFTYDFRAEPHGTHMWHGHSGFQESDGLFGVLTIMRNEPPHVKSLYDFDLPEHTIVIWHWYDRPTREVVLPILQRNESITGFGFLINGKASFKKFPNKSGKPDDFTSTPKAVFKVQKGFRYRFRLGYNGAIYCPIQLSIDGHTLIAIAGDTSPFQPVEVDSIMVAAGDRFDFVVNAQKEDGCYWIRLRALGDCDKTKMHTEALLCYGNAILDDRKSHNYLESKRPGKLLNPSQVLFQDYVGNELVHLVDLNSTEIDEKCYGGAPNITIYVQVHSKPYDDIPYPGPWHQLNDFSFKFPKAEFLFGQLHSTGFCDESTRNMSCGENNFCSCTYREQIPKGSLVEIVFVDISVDRNQDHPIHLHGYKFYIVAMGWNKTLQEVKSLNEKGLIRKKLQQAPSKDTLSVPSNGYAIIRFMANNTGYWMLHCHVTNHMEMGMAMLLQVGTREEILSQCKNNKQGCSNWYNSHAIEIPTSNVLVLLALLSIKLIN